MVYVIKGNNQSHNAPHGPRRSSSSSSRMMMMMMMMVTMMIRG